MMNAFKNINKTSRSKRTDQSTAHSRTMRTTQISGVSDTFMAGNMAQNAFKTFPVMYRNNGWVSLLEALLITVYVAYFGSRGAEKIQKIRK